MAGELVGEQALVFRQCVEAHADRLFLRLSQADHDLCPELPLPTRATVLALALAELVLRGSTVDRGDTSTGPACDVTLVIEATTPHTQGSTGATDSTGARQLIDRRDRREPAEPGRWPEVFDPYHRTALADRADRGGHNPLTDHCGPATTPDGFHVPHHVAACLLCDPVITALIVDALGVPLDMGRQIRLANRRNNAGPSSAATAAASSRAVTPRSAGATPTTSPGGTTTDPPTSRIWPCCAATTTASPTAPAGP